MITFEGYPAMEYLLVTAYVFLFVFIIRRSSFFQINKKISWLLPVFFVLKCLSGIALGLIYLHYYTNHSDADTFKFFTDSKFIYDTLLEKPYDFFRMLTGINGGDPELRQYYVQMDAWLNTSPLYNDNRTMIRLNTVFRFFSLGYYNVHVVFLNFISFTGLFCLYKTFRRYLEGKEIELLLLIFLLPSVMFWGSGLLKDGLSIMATGLLMLSWDSLIRNGINPKRLSAFLLSLFILAFIKVYVAMLMLPGLLAWYLTRNKKGITVALTFIALYAIYFITAFNLYHLKDEWNVAALIFYKQKNFIEIGMQHAATMISVLEYECSGISIALHSPEAFANTLLRPFIWESKGNPMVLLSAFENGCILILLFVFFLFSDFRRKAEPIVVHSFAFVLFLYSLVGLITPILGAIVRYRIIGLPFLIFFMLYFYDRNRFLNFFTRKGSASKEVQKQQ